MSGVVRWTRIGFIVSAWLFALAVVVQVFLAGMSMFGAPERLSDHVSFGQMVGTLTILMVVFALIGRLGWLTTGLSVAVFFLYGFQFIFANADSAAVGAFHAVNALVLFWLTVHLARQALRRTFAARSR